MSLWRWLWFGPERERPPEQKCLNCVHFIDYRDETEEYGGANGYCGHPNHSKWWAEHREYGGHWTHSESWCPWWTPVGSLAEGFDVKQAQAGKDPA